jgi:hypothetical protein
VLGRHIPAAPSLMRAVGARPGGAGAGDLPGPVLVVGLAETAVCLGQSVFEELARRPGFTGHFIHSTRQQIDHPLLCRFEEPHSHASAHLIYRPLGVDLGAVRTLVLVDDEVSTGTTLTNLAAALLDHLPRCERIVAAALTDWSGGGDWLGRMPRPADLRQPAVRQPALGSGRRAAARRRNPASTAPRPRSAAWPSTAITAASAGTAAPPPPPRRPRRAAPARRRHRRVHLPALPAGRAIGSGGARRRDAVDQPQPRSARRRDPPRLAFEDNYATGLPNFLYNADPADGRTSLICHETPPESIDAALIAALKATCISF